MQPYTINELEELARIIMNQTKTTILNTDMLVQGIRNKHFIVGSFTEHQGFSVSSTPVMHTSRSLARQECNRLAKLTPSKLYIFVELSGGEMQPAVVNTISI